MALVTITSDLGTRDFYLAALKGAIITHCGTVNILDVTHSIKAFDIKEAAFAVRNAYKYFPKGTIHIVHVNSSEGKGKLLLAIVDGHYFLTFDNGFLSIAFEKSSHETYHINDELTENNSLLYEEAIAKVIDLLLKEYKPSDFAHLTTDTVDFRMMQPINSNGSIRGTVIYIDNFGNAVTNITKKMFDEFIGDKKFTIYANIAHTNIINRTFAEEEEGDLVCLFNSTCHLEIAINKAKAELLLGLKIDSAVLVLAD